MNKKQTLKGIDSIQTVYAFAIALGLREVFIGMNRFFSENLSGSEAYDAPSLLIIILFINIILLGVRFFWVPSNLRRLMIAAVTDYNKRKEEGQAVEKQVLPNYNSAIHIIVIIAHGALYYFICSEFSYIAFVLSSPLPLEASTFHNYIILHAAILIVNAIWIARIANQILTINKGKSQSSVKDPGSAWWRNNAICGLMAIGPFYVSNSCRGSMIDCVENTQPIEPIFTILLPISPDKAASILASVHWFSDTFISGGILLVVWCSCFFFINSVIDFIKTGTDYLITEDGDWVKL